MILGFSTEGIEELIDTVGFDDAKNVLTGRAVSAIKVEVDRVMQQYAERREARQKDRIVGSPASVHNQPRPADPPPSEPKPEPNYYAPKKILQVMLRREWFAQVCTHVEIYNKEWTDRFVAALMDSEHKDYLALKWSKSNQQKMMKAHLVGLLSDAGVIKGSGLEIARTILRVSPQTHDKDKEREVKTLAKYMGRGKREPYADWVMDYIEKQS